MLNKNTPNEKLQRDERQGKMLLHTEYSLLSLLEGQKGVIQQHGLFSVSLNEKYDLFFSTLVFGQYQQIIKFSCISIHIIGHGI